jgi:hypothetical protein
MRQIFAAIAFIAISSVASADLPTPASPFDGKCSCTIPCEKAYIDGSAGDTQSAEYKVQYSTTAIAEDTEKAVANEKCSTAAATTRYFSPFKKDISPKDLVIQLCTKGAKNHGHCVDTSVCASAISCVAG